MASFINWKSGFILIALLIVAASLYYTNNLANDLSQEERKKVAILAKSKINDYFGVLLFKF